MDFTVKFAHVREQVETDDHGKWDAVVPQQEILLCGGQLEFPQAYAGYRPNSLVPTAWATAQLCGRLGIPTVYFRRCPPHMQEAQFNDWCRRSTTDSAEGVVSYWNPISSRTRTHPNAGCRGQRKDRSGIS